MHAIVLSALTVRLHLEYLNLMLCILCDGLFSSFCSFINLIYDVFHMLRALRSTEYALDNSYTHQ